MASPEENPADERRAGKCERCGGTGETEAEPYERGGVWVQPTVRCPDCGGSGLDGTGAP